MLSQISLIEYCKPRYPLVVVGELQAMKCPAHGDTKESLIFYPKNNSWWCFGCSKGSDTIEFLRYVEKRTFSEAYKIAYSLGEEADLVTHVLQIQSPEIRTGFSNLLTLDFSVSDYMRRVYQAGDISFEDREILYRHLDMF